ncbi:unnamed protein product [Chrysoparadoxa australica]
MAMDGASIDALHHGVLAAQDMFAHLAPVSSSMSEQMVAHVGQGLAAADATAEEAVKQDWFAQFVQLFETSIRSINTFYKGVGVEQSFGLSVVTFTLFIKVLLLPLNYVQLLSTERTQLLQPIQKQINEKFANNEEVKQQVIQRLYTSADVNPLAGCLPSLAQIPVFIGLYRSMAAIAQENIADEPFLWIPNLEGPVFDAGRGIAWLTQNWVDGAPPLGWHDTLAYASIPIFLVLSQSISMRIMSPPTDPNDEAMQRTSTVLKFLPLMIGWFSLNVPSALGVCYKDRQIKRQAHTFPCCSCMRPSHCSALLCSLRCTGWQTMCSPRLLLLVSSNTSRPTPQRWKSRMTSSPHHCLHQLVDRPWLMLWRRPGSTPSPAVRAAAQL